MSLLPLPEAAPAADQNRRILVIDDNPSIHEDIRKILGDGQEGLAEVNAMAADLFDDAPPSAVAVAFELDSAYQGEEGLAAVKGAVAAGRPYALAFVDVRMPPGWDGIETIAHLWKADPDLQVVICSAFSDHSWPEIMARLSPADGLLILRKPFDSVEIRQIAHALAAKWSLRRQNQRQLADLEKLVAERTCELLRANESLRREGEERARMEVERRLANKLEAVGQLAAGIAHELNTPIQFLADSVHFLETSSQDLTTLLDGQRSLLGRVAQDQPAVLAELRSLEETADIEFLRQEIPRAFERTFEGTRRVTTIVRALKEFAHPDRREKSPANLNQALENTLTVARNEYKYVAEVETNLGEIPPVLCHVGDLNQVFLNLIVNAAHAIGDVVKDSGNMGRIRIGTAREGKDVLVTISDTGCGIPQTIADRVYDPFFTTKEVGKGTGQGLAIARSIVVDKHQGSITFQSEIGQGTAFTIRLPIGDPAWSEERA